MKKKILKKLIILSVTFTCIFTGIFACFRIYDKIKDEGNFLTIIVQQTTEGIVRQEESEENAKKIFINDYLNRVGFCKMIFEKQGYENTNSLDWKKIIDVIDVEQIYIINKDGIIIDGSEKFSVGIDFFNESRLNAFVNLIANGNVGDYQVEFNRNSILTGKTMVYLIQKVHEDYFIELAIQPIALLEYLQDSSLENYITNIPTKYTRTIFVADKETGDILAITKNNEQTVNMENKVEQINKSLDKLRVVKVNGKYQLFTTHMINDELIIGEYSLISELIFSTFSNIVVFFLLIVISAIATTIILYFLLDNLVLKDISNIIDTAEKFVEGKNVRFSPGDTEEMTSLSHTLNKFISSIDESYQRITSTVALLGESYAGYEYFVDLDHVYYSDNLPAMFEMTIEECLAHIKKIYQSVKHDDDEIVQLDGHYETKSGRTLKIKRIVSCNSVYAFVEDITHDVRSKEIIQKELQIEKIKGITDDLTGLYNRKGLVEYVNKNLMIGTKIKGILLLMDLDNFKKVNDNLGHMTGDIVLKQFATLLDLNFRDEDIKSRMGGDEFVVFIPAFINEESLVDKMKKFLYNTKQELHEFYEQFELSVSIGAVYIDNNYHSFEEIYSAADDAMYHAKHAGKDGFAIWKEEMKR